MSPLHGQKHNKSACKDAWKWVFEAQCRQNAIHLFIYLFIEEYSDQYINFSGLIILIWLARL